MGIGTRLPPEWRNKARARLAFQRQRLVKNGDGGTSMACTTTSSTVLLFRKENTLSSGKLCVSPREMTMPSSVAAACSSKSNVTQNRLRSARPQARLMAAPKGACMISCIPPASSKKRSATTVVVDGKAPSTAIASRT